ncbi:MAG: hypothetical protein UHP27_03990 [Muribaculaceae bacterium]|nr:hypothetical protein [Muribaculaceae bacterium]
MSFLNKIKVAFGMGADEDDNLIDDDPDTTTETVRRLPHPAVQKPQEAHTSFTISRVPDDKEREANATAIFDHVVKTFNEALPDFLAKSVDPEAQKRQLLAGLNDDLKNYIERLNLAAQKEGQRRWDAEKNKLSANLRELETRTREFDEQRNLLNQKQLSADRQKRALNEKVHDLETKVMALEAEKEQFQLENKSLLNKLKVAAVYETENEELRKQLSGQGGAQAGSGHADGELRAENARISAELSQTKAKLEETVKELETAKAELAAAQAELSEAKKARSQAEDEAKAAKAEAERLATELENAGDVIPEEMAEKLQEIEKQLQQFDEIKSRKDQRISELTAQLKAAEEKVANLDKVVALNIDTQSKSEQKLRAEIDAARKSAATWQAEAEKLQKELAAAKNASRGQRKERTEKVRTPRTPISEGTPIEDILGDTDWMVSASSLRPNGDADSRRQNRRKDPPENDSQLSLF